MKLEFLENNYFKFVILVLFLSGLLGLATYKYDNFIQIYFIILAFCAAIMSIFLLFKFPEIGFALFLIISGLIDLNKKLKIPEFINLNILLATLLLLAVILVLIREKRGPIVLPKELLIPYFIILFIGLVSLSYTAAPIYGLSKLTKISTIIMLSLFLPLYIFFDKERVNRFFVTFILFSSSVIILKHLNFLNFFGITYDPQSYITLGRFSGISILALCFYFFPYQRLPVKILISAIVSLNIEGMLIAGGRGPLIALFACFAFSFMLMYFKQIKELVSNLSKGRLAKFVFISIATLISILLIINLVPNFSGTLPKTLSRMQLLTQFGGVNSASSRISRFEKAADIMSSFPNIISGVGIGGFSKEYSDFDDVNGAYPHNIFLEVGSEMGIFALLSIVYIIFIGFYNLYLYLSNKDLEHTGLGFTIVLLLFFMVINASVSGDINSNRLLFTFIGFTFCVGIASEKNNKSIQSISRL